MQPFQKIPPLALLGLVYTGCGGDDEATLVGRWDAVEINGMTYPWNTTEDGVQYTNEVELTIDADLSGLWAQNISAMGGSDDYSYDYDYPLTVEETETGAYVLSIPDKDLELSCELKGAELDCLRDGAVDPKGASYKFRRAD
jgi:hypothetical protein